MRKPKKSQAALEFLSTYAFAFIAISIAIAGLYYFGFLDFKGYLPQKCVFPSQFKCSDFSLSSSPNEVRLKLVNNIGEEIDITSLDMKNDAAPSILCTPPSTPINWKPSEYKEFVFTACTGGAYIPDERVELKITMVYNAVNSPSHTPHTISGKINGRVKQ